MAGHGDEGATESPAHVLDKTRLAAAGGALQHDRQPGVVGGLVQLDLISDRQVVRLFLELEILDALTFDRHR